MEEERARREPNRLEMEKRVKEILPHCRECPIM